MLELILETEKRDARIVLGCIVNMAALSFVELRG